ncbi:MAG TPA: transporter, partial [Candidatus Deferrimicrobium sp.]
GTLGMNPTRAAIASAMLFCSVLIGAGGETLAGHPLGTEDAGTQGKGNVEVEFNLERQHGNDGMKILSLGNIITMGIAPKIDLAVGYAYDFTKAEDGMKSRAMGPVVATLKTAIIEGKDRLPTFGVKAGFSLPTSEGDQAALLATAIAQWSFEPMTVFANVGADIGTHVAGNAEKNSSIRASVAGTYDLRKEWSLLSELLWEKQISPSAPSTSEWLIGAKKEIAGTLNVNGGFRWGLNGDSPHVTYLLGFTLGFRGDPSAQAAAAPAGDKK